MSNVLKRIATFLEKFVEEFVTRRTVRNLESLNFWRKIRLLSTNSLEARGHSEASSSGRLFAIKLIEHVVHLVKSILKQERSFKKFAWILRDVLRKIRSSDEISNHYHCKKSMTWITVS